MGVCRPRAPALSAPQLSCVLPGHLQAEHIFIVVVYARPTRVYCYLIIKRLHIFESGGKKRQQQKCHMHAAVIIQTHGRRSYNIRKCHCCDSSGAQVIRTFPCKTNTIVAKKHLPKSVLFPLPLGPICTAKPRSFDCSSQPLRAMWAYCF